MANMVFLLKRRSVWLRGYRSCWNRILIRWPKINNVNVKVTEEQSSRERNKWRQESNEEYRLKFSLSTFQDKFILWFWLNIFMILKVYRESRSFKILIYTFKSKKKNIWTIKWTRLFYDLYLGILYLYKYGSK